ncbi:hypothetical protein BsWGS_17754 [Bradybaena similaris]
MNPRGSTELRLLAVTVIYILTEALTSATSVDAFSSDEIRAMEKFAGDVMGCVGIPGLSIGVVRGDATFSTGFGVASMATAHSADKRTMFHLGSTSKALVPYILAEIINGKENHDGRITWNSTLREILAHDRDLEAAMPWADMTLKDMLVYKSGSSAADLATMVGLPREVGREEIIRRLRFIPDNAEFLNSNHYSNIMFTVAGHLAERMTGRNWSEIVKSRVLDKLKMDTSSFATEGMTLEDFAIPYRFHSSQDPFVEQNISLFNLEPFLPVGSFMSSADDVTKWLRHLLHNLHATGNDSGINMLVGDAFHQWVTVPGDHHEGTLYHESEVALGYGMGWYASTYRGERRFKFSGSLYAYSSQIWLFPDTSSAIFVSMSGPGNDCALKALEVLMFYTSDVTLRESTWVDTNMTCCCQGAGCDYDDHKEVAPEELKQIKYLAPVEKYIGVYGHGLVGDLKIEPNKAGVLILQLGRNLIGELTPGVTESKLKFTVSSPLLSTEEWYSEKTIEFLYSAHQTGDERNTDLYDNVRIYIKDNLFYEFNRGKTFESMLIMAEEEDRRQREETEALTHKNHNRKFSNNETATNDADYSYEDNDLVKEEVGNHEINYTVSNLQHGDGTKNPNHRENDIKSSSKFGLATDRKGNSENSNSYHTHTSEDQSDEPALSDTNNDTNEGETNHKQKDKHPLNKEAGNTSSNLKILYTLAFVMLLISFMF